MIKRTHTLPFNTRGLKSDLRRSETEMPKKDEASLMEALYFACKKKKEGGSEGEEHEAWETKQVEWSAEIKKNWKGKWAVPP